jgi:benzoyl-CoA 2,3-dioxygenase component A
VVGPFGATFLMPDDPDADIVMICTGTGAAPFRGFTERRRRTSAAARGRLHLFFGARTPQELPYFGPLQKVPTSLLDQELVYSRLPGQPREYVQDRMRTRAADIAELLRRPTTHVFICGLRGLEDGVEAALGDIGRQYGIDWPESRARMLGEGRYHAETY